MDSEGRGKGMKDLKDVACRRKQLSKGDRVEAIAVLDPVVLDGLDELPQLLVDPLRRVLRSLLLHLALVDAPAQLTVPHILKTNMHGDVICDMIDIHRHAT
jgi:hypothetical protein